MYIYDKGRDKVGAVPFGNVMLTSAPVNIVLMYILCIFMNNDHLFHLVSSP